MKDPAADVPIYGAPPPRGAESETLWAAILAAGPPPEPDPVLEAIELLSDHLGAVIVPA